jgi:hypothetical protein
MESKKVNCPKCGKTPKIKDSSLKLFGFAKVNKVKMYSCECGEEFAIGKMVDSALLKSKNKLKVAIAK